MWRVRLVPLFVLASLAAAPPVMAQGPSLVFAEKEVSLSLDELRKGAHVTVLNRRPRPMRARFRLSSLGLRSAATPPSNLSTAASIRLRPIRRIPAASQRRVLIHAPNLQLAEALYTGSLAVYATRPDSVSRIPFTIDAREKPPAAAKPAVAALEDVAQPTAPWNTASKNIEVPLDARDGTPTLTPGQSIGVLADDSGSIAEVVIADGKLTQLSNGFYSTAVRIEGLDTPSTYKGKVDLSQGDDEGVMELSVDVQDAIGWALLPLALGIGLAVWRLHWSGVGIVGLAMEARRTAAEQKHTEVLEQFKEGARGKPWETYDTTQAFNRESEAARKAIEQLAATSFDELDEKAREAIEAQIERLEQVAESLGTLGEALLLLEEALQQAGSLGAPDGLPGPETPGFVVSAREVLEGRDVESFDEIDTLLATIAATAALARRWPSLYAEAERAAARIRHDDSEAMLTARQKLTGAWRLLSEAESAGMIVERRLEDRLVEALATAAEVGPTDPVLDFNLFVAEPEGAAHRTRREAAVEAFIPTLPSTLRTLPTRPAARLEAIAGARRRGSLTLLALAAVVALYTGLEAFYFGKTFGSFWDYLGAFVWGLGATTAVNAIAEATRGLLTSGPRVG